MHWVKAVRFKYFCYNDPNWTAHVKHIELRWRSDGTMWYQVAKADFLDSWPNYMEEKFEQFRKEPMTSPLFSEEQFLAECERQIKIHVAGIVFIKNEEELNAAAQVRENHVQAD